MGVLRKTTSAILAFSLSMTMVAGASLALENAAQETTTILQAQSTDPHPATFASVSVDKLSAKTGETVTVTYHVDDVEGVQRVSPLFTIGETSGAGNPEDGLPSTRGVFHVAVATSSTETQKQSFPITITADLEQGMWCLVGLEVQDKAGYVTKILDSSFYDGTDEAKDPGVVLADLSAARFEVIQTPDPHPAAFVSVTADKQSVSVGETVTIRCDVADEDDVAYVSQAYVVFSDAEAEASAGEDRDGSRTVGLHLLGSVSSTGTSVPKGIASLRVTSDTTPGIWRLAQVEVMDETGHRTTFLDKQVFAGAELSEGEAFADLSAARFEVVHTPDPHPATFRSASVDRERVGVGGNVTVHYDIADDDGIDYISDAYVVFANAEAEAELTKEGDGSRAIALRALPSVATSSTSTTPLPKGTKVSPVTSDTTPGIWRLAQVDVMDEAGHRTTFLDRQVFAGHELREGESFADLSGVRFEVAQSPDEEVRPTYSVTKGGNTTYDAVSSTTDGLKFTFDGPFDKFYQVKVDGVVVSPDSYVVEAGSTVITLAPAYLKTLEEGTHKLEVLYTDGGSAEAMFAVRAVPEEKDGGVDKEDAGKANKDGAEDERKQDEQKGTVLNGDKTNANGDGANAGNADADNVGTGNTATGAGVPATAYMAKTPTAVTSSNAPSSAASAAMPKTGDATSAVAMSLLAAGALSCLAGFWRAKRG